MASKTSTTFGLSIVNAEANLIKQLAAAAGIPATTLIRSLLPSDEWRRVILSRAARPSEADALRILDDEGLPLDEAQARASEDAIRAAMGELLARGVDSIVTEAKPDFCVHDLSHGTPERAVELYGEFMQALAHEAGTGGTHRFATYPSGGFWESSGKRGTTIIAVNTRLTPSGVEYATG